MEETMGFKFQVKYFFKCLFDNKARKQVSTFLRSNNKTSWIQFSDGSSMGISKWRGRQYDKCEDFVEDYEDY